MEHGSSNVKIVRFECICGYSEAWKCGKLANPLSYIHKVNGTWQQQSSGPQEEPYNIMWSQDVKIVIFECIHGYSEAWKGRIQASKACQKLANPLPYIHRANGTWQQQSPRPQEEPYSIMWSHDVKIVIFRHIRGYSEAWKGWIQPVKHVESLQIHCHTSIRQMEHGISNHHVHRKQEEPYSIMWSHDVKIVIFGHIRGYSEAWKGWIQACKGKSCGKLANPLQYFHKANGTWQQQS